MLSVLRGMAVMRRRATGSTLQIGQPPQASRCVPIIAVMDEGCDVAKPTRRQAIVGGLAAAAKHWARSRGCTEMALDTELANRVSESARLRLGYDVAARVTAFSNWLT